MLNSKLLKNHLIDLSPHHPQESDKWMDKPILLFLGDFFLGKKKLSKMGNYQRNLNNPSPFSLCTIEQLPWKGFSLIYFSKKEAKRWTIILTSFSPQVLMIGRLKNLVPCSLGRMELIPAACNPSLALGVLISSATKK